MQMATFGTLPSGRPIHAYSMGRPEVMRLTVLDVGGIIQSLEVPDRHGVHGDVVLGFETLDGYLADTSFQGAVIGRYANRIANGRFHLDGVDHVLTVNDGPHALHGGPHGFHRMLWDAEPVNDTTLVLRLRTPDDHEGFPGALAVSVTYALVGTTLLVHYDAVTDRATPINFTQHSYWNLGGWTPNAPPAPITDHVLTIHADQYTPVDAQLIPTGLVEEVAGTPLDFRAALPIGAHIDDPHAQLQHAAGFDHNYVLRSGADATGLHDAAMLLHARSGRTLQVRTTEPGMQFYSGNFLDGSMRGKGGHRLAHRTGCCLETQHFPDSPNQPGFPNTILRPGERFRSTTTFTFGVVA